MTYMTLEVQVQVDFIVPQVSSISHPIWINADIAVASVMNLEKNTKAGIALKAISRFLRNNIPLKWKKQKPHIKPL